MHRPYTLTISRLGFAAACRTPAEAQRAARHVLNGVPDRASCPGAIYGPGLPRAGLTVR